MKIPTEIESRNARLKKRFNFGCGLLLGLLIFGLGAIRVLSYGFEAINILTWIALGLGVFLFAFLAARFGDDFWSLFND